MAFEFPFLRFAESHEYANADGELVRVGISAFAVDQLGDIVFVDLPEVGAGLDKGATFGSVESVKAVRTCTHPSPAGGATQRRVLRLEELQNDPTRGWLLVGVW